MLCPAIESGSETVDWVHSGGCVPSYRFETDWNAPPSTDSCTTPKSHGQPAPPFAYLPCTAYHVLPGTHTDESGYFSLCEGRNGMIYIGTAAYGLNAYLIEFDPRTNRQRVVLDVNNTIGVETPPPSRPSFATCLP